MKEKNGYGRLFSDAKIRKILLESADGETYASLARRYSVNGTVMWQIVNRTTYLHVAHPLGRLADVNITLDRRKNSRKRLIPTLKPGRLP